MPVEKLYTVSDVADITGMTSRTIRNYLKDGTLTGVKVGAQWRFTQAEIESLFSRRQPGAKSPTQLIKGYMNDIEKSKNSCCIVIGLDKKTENQAKKTYEAYKDACTGKKGIKAVTYEYIDSQKLLRIAFEGRTEAIVSLLGDFS